MIDALRGKTERGEDVITSAVFGTLKYLGRPDIVAQFLSRATTIDGKRLQDIFDTTFSAAEFDFWPGWAEIAREPDLVITLRKGERPHTIALVEAKFGSPTSDKKPEDVSGEDHPKQLVAYWKQLLHTSKYGAVPEERRFLVYVTARFDKRDDIDLASHAEGKLPGDPRRQVGWLHWSEIEALFEELSDKPDNQEFLADSGRAAMVDDMKRILHKEGIAPFLGFGRLSRKIEETAASCPWGEPLVFFDYKEEK